jgi:hypothetical protein
LATNWSYAGWISKMAQGHRHWLKQTTQGTAHFLWNQAPLKTAWAKINWAR